MWQSKRMRPSFWGVGINAWRDMLTYNLRNNSGQSLYGQLYQHIRSGIESGAIAAGEKLPAKRPFAQHLGVSLITVDGAYAQLVAEGYVLAKPRCGYFAADLHQCSFALRVDPGKRPAPVASTEREIQRDTPASALFSARAPGAGCLDRPVAEAARGRLPYKAWARCVRGVLGSESESTLIAASEASGSYELRQAIASYLHGHRGMEVDPDQIIVGAGSQTLYALTVQLLGRNRHFAIETPGYVRLAMIYRAHDVRLSFAGMDHEGVDPECLRKSGADVLHCTPSHQYPLGLVMSAPRRRQLLEWAAGSSGDPSGLRRYIIEDDYDCEFRMSGRPIPALCSIDTGGHVIYTNTFTKSLGSSFRIAYAVLPPHLAERFRQTLGFYTCTVGAVEQLALARFIASGEYERHVNRQRTYYRRVQDGLVGALKASSCARKLRFSQVGAGLHFVLDADCQCGEKEFAGRLAAEGVHVVPVSACNMERVFPGAPVACPDSRRPGTCSGEAGDATEGGPGRWPPCKVVVSLTDVDENSTAAFVRAFEKVLA